MMKALLFFAAAFCAAALQGVQICPPSQMVFKPSDNGSSTNAFQCSVAADDAIRIEFNDQSRADNYLHIDCGIPDWKGLLPGGYLEVDASLDRPLLRLSGAIAEPTDFWPSRVLFVGEMKMKQGRHRYRIYLDSLPAFRLAERKDRFYLFLHDLGGESKGRAVLTIHNTRFVPSAPGWEQAKNDCYREQFQWRKFSELGSYYRGKYDRNVAAETIESSPFRREILLDGMFQKWFAGDITWRYSALADFSPAAPGVPLRDAVQVRVPEKPQPDQPGGYYWYKRDFDCDFPAGTRALLRIDDLADTAEIFLNGKRVGTQSSVRRRHDWVLKNGSRQSGTWGKPAREVAMYQHFERCGIAFPFDRAALPDDDEMLLPILLRRIPVAGRLRRHRTAAPRTQYDCRPAL